jgi:hypothetical protein
VVSGDQQRGVVREAVDDLLDEPVDQRQLARQLAESTPRTWPVRSSSAV